jgi:hypothetical protein
MARRYRKAVGRASRLGGGGGCTVGESCQYYVMGQGTTIPGVRDEHCSCVRADFANQRANDGRMVGASGRRIDRRGAIRGGIVQGMMAATGRTPIARASGGCEQDGSAGQSCLHYNSQGVPCQGTCRGMACECDPFADDWIKASGRDDCGFLRQSGIPDELQDAFDEGGADALADALFNYSDPYQEAYESGGVSSLLDALANQPPVDAFESGGAEGLLDSLAEPIDPIAPIIPSEPVDPIAVARDPLTPTISGDGGGMPPYVPPTPTYPVGPVRDPLTPVISGGGGGMPPYVPPTPTYPVRPSGTMPPPSSRRRQGRRNPSPRRPMGFQRGFGAF